MYNDAGIGVSQVKTTAGQKYSIFMSDSMSTITNILGVFGGALKQTDASISSRLQKVVLGGGAKVTSDIKTVKKAADTTVKTVNNVTNTAKTIGSIPPMAIIGGIGLVLLLLIKK